MDFSKEMTKKLPRASGKTSEPAGSPAFNQAFDQAVSAEALASYRLNMLNAQLRYARQNSRFYNRVLQDCRLPLASVGDLSSVPFTTPDDVQIHGKEMVCVGADQIERIVTIPSTGSSGSPKRLFFSQGDLSRTADFFHIGMKYMCGAGDEVFIFMPAASENSIGLLLARGLEKLGAQPRVFGVIGDNPADYKEAAEALMRADPHTLVGIPSQMRRLALAAPDIRPENALLSADYIPWAAKEAISRIWGCEVFEHYGLTESGYGCAVECKAHEGQHIRHDELLLEIIEPRGVNPVPDGQWGEIVLTTLRREAMPLIRYRTGDISRLICPVCACGSELPRLDRVRGRISEITREVNIYEMDELLLSCDGIYDYRASFSDGALTIAVEAASPEGLVFCGESLAKKWPDLKCNVIPANAPPTERPPAGALAAGRLQTGRNAKRGITRSG